MKRIISLCFITFILLNCEESLTPNNTMFIGAWIDNGYEEDVRVLKRANDLSEDKGGYLFKSDNTLKDRKNAGFCGTPPISYATYDGIWSQLNVDRLKIISDYWGGIDTVEVEIISLDEDELKLRPL